MEWWQVMADHQRVEVRNVHEVRHFRAPAFKVSRPDATLLPSEDTLVWEPNLTVAANEDHKGYHSLIGEFLALVRGQPEAASPHSRAPNAEDGARAMHWLEVMIKSAQV
jgi:myo-inositol 2-dehydrogenase/D-chiro-inositol 1-dehydrogenase